jgi:putative ABC transport system permease protein
MWRLSISHVRTHKSRFALTLLAVVLGVTFVAGSLILTDTSKRLFDDQFRTASAGVDLTVRGAAAFGSAMGVEVDRDPLPANLVDQVRKQPGVAEARPAVRGQGLLTFRGQAIVPTGASMLNSWAAAPFSAFTLKRGAAPTAADEVVVDAATAEAHDITLGDTVTVTAKKVASLEVVGFARFGDRNGLPNTTVALVSIDTAQKLLDFGNGFSEVQVLAEDGISGSALRPQLGQALGAKFEVAGAQDAAGASADAAKAQLSYLQIMLMALAGAALLVGAFLIANTFSIVISQRTRELAVLRAAGATGRQVLGSVLGEAVLIGVVGSIAGTALGIAAALGLRDLVGTFGVALPDGGITITPRTLIVSLVLGLLVTIVSAVGPARKAARVEPVAAMRQSAANAGTSGRARTIGGVLSAVIGAALVGGVAAGGAVPLLAPGALFSITGLTMLGPVLAPRLSRLLGRPLDRAGVAGRLARESAARAPRRTSATAMALALGLALISFMSIVATSVKGSIANSYKEVIAADYVIESARAEMLGGLSPEVLRKVEALPQVAVASPIRYGHWKDRGVTSALTAIDPKTLAGVANLDMVKGSTSALEAGGVVIAEHVAIERGLDIGDRLPMTFSRNGNQKLPIVGLVDDDDAQALSTDFLISLDTYAKQFSEDVDASVFVKIVEGVEATAAKTAINAALAVFPTADVRDQAAAVAGRTATVDQILGLVTVLLLLAVLIALLGITNTLALGIVERTREIGLLRAVGMTTRQVRWMVRIEAVLVAAIAVVLGVGLGIAFGTSTVTALARNATIEVSFPVGQLALVVTVATLAGLIAGVLPARRAARLDVLEAISTE